MNKLWLMDVDIESGEKSGCPGGRVGGKHDMQTAILLSNEDIAQEGAAWMPDTALLCDQCITRT